jgi:large subunit ribosomal protein L31
MRTELHPRLIAATATCGNCGATFALRSTVSELHLDVCSHCHPAYTDEPARRATRGSQVERFARRWGTSATQPAAN